MSILFKDWIISSTDELLARQYDNLSRSLVVTGDLPDGWDWAILVQCGQYDDTIMLTPMEGGVGAYLTRDQLAFGDCYYNFQLRGTQGDVEKRTNQINVYIPASLSGSGTWPAVPSEFTQAEARMREMLANGQAAESNAAASAQTAQDAAQSAAADRAAAQTALQGMTFVSFDTDADGHLLIRNGDLLGSTAFGLNPVDAAINAGHLEVNY